MKPVSQTIELTGLSVGPSQVWRAVRLVPLFRDVPIDDLRLDSRCWGQVSAVAVKHAVYTAFVPHAFVASWSEDGAPLAALGTQSTEKQDDKRRAGQYFPIRFAHRVAKRVRKHGAAQQRLRFLPLHTAFEAYMALHFAGPNVLRREYSDAVLSHGLSPRIESVTPGEWLPGLEEALRVFEIHPGQVGTLIFVADTLAAAFVVPRPDDYRRLHRTLLSDFYGELIYHYACMYSGVGPLASSIRAERVDSLHDLAGELARVRADWSVFLHSMACGLFEQPVTLEHVYKLGRHHLFRFLPAFRLGQENHIGELIRAPDGALAYLKTFRLSDAQVRRGHLLSTLAQHDWDLDTSAAALNGSKDELCHRLERAGFGQMLRAHLRRLELG
jgi:hypothetical protein